MTTLHRLRTLVFGCAGTALILALTACASSGDGGDSTGARTSTTKLTTLLPARIVKSKTLVVGMLTGGSSAMDAMSGSRIVGFDPDLVTAIGKELGVRVSVKPAAFDGLIAGIHARRYDVAIGSMGDTAERQKSVSFVDYLNIGVAKVVKKGNAAHIRADQDLCGKSVAVLTGGYPQTTLVPAVSGACTKAGKSKVHVSTFNDVSSAVVALQAGRTDCLYDDTAAAAYLLRKAGDQFEQVGTSKTLARTGIAFAKSDVRLGNAVEGALRSLTRSGDYARIAKAWNLSAERLPSPSINRALI